MPVPNPNIAVYTEGPLVTPSSLIALTNWVNSLSDGAQKTMLQKDLQSVTQASDVATAGYTTVIVGLCHVNDDGTINYNDFPYDSNTSAAFNEAIQALKTTPGSTVKTVLVSFGGGNWWGHPASVSDTDYPHMKANWSTFKPALIAFMQDANVDGVDWDYEPEMVPFDVPFITRITNEIAAKNFLITAAPYNYADLGNWQSVIDATVKTGGTGNNFAWWNLQVYGGADYSQWITMLQGASIGITGSAVEQFLIPGYEQQDCDDSGTISQLKSVKQNYPSVGGAFIWNFGGMPGCAAQVASDLKAVL
ncbi:MAG: hypothetical protein QOJ05_420 [Verrucomicrobiota bacterium]